MRVRVRVCTWVCTGVCCWLRGLCVIWAGSRLWAAVVDRARGLLGARGGAWGCLGRQGRASWWGAS